MSDSNSPHEHKGKGRPREFDRKKALCAALGIFWKRGFEPATVSELCKAMDINPPSLYAAFGNKAELFLEAARYYEDTYWKEPARRLMQEEDIYAAIGNFFDEAARILISPDTPCGCMVALGAVNISAAEKEIIAAIGQMRLATKNMFVERLRAAIQRGQIPADTNVPALAGALNTFLEGMSLQARDGLFLSELKAIAAYAVKLLPQAQ